MSFPGRTPMGMPGMGPRMMPQSFAFTPMTMPGMMPMQMGMMTPMMRPMNMMTTQIPQMQMQPQIKQNKLVPQEIPKSESKEEKPPVTTVFVGNISERAPDMMIKQMLQRCGNVLSWKRVQGASGKLQAFGFCEYEEPEATLRCIRLLNEWQIADKKLMVKVDTKTKTLLDEYRKKKKGAESANKKESTENGDSKEEKEEAEVKKEKEEETKEESSEELDEDSKREDRVASAGLEAIMREYAFELAKEPIKLSEPAQEKEKVLPKKDKDLLLHAKDTGFDDMEMEDEKREIINREINKFRDRHKDDDEDKEKESKDRERNLLREREQRRMEEKRQRERMERLREQRDRDITRDRDRDRASTRISRSRSRSVSPAPRSRKRSRSREMTSRDRSRERRKEKEIEEEEEAYERRKLEKKLREKEAAYQERLKNWESRERKKSREYEKENEREEERKSEEAREARRLKEFLEDYDDLRDDPKFYKGSGLMRRLKEREKEKELDNRDRQREKEEFEEIKRKLFDEGHPDAETEVARMEREREEHLLPRLHLQEIKQQQQQPPPPPPVVAESDSEPEPIPEPPKPIADSPKQRNHHQAISNPPQHVVAEPKRSPSLSTSPISTDSRISAPGLFMDESSQSSLPGALVSTARSRDEIGNVAARIKLGPSVSPDSSSLPGTSIQLDGKRKKFTIGDVFNQDDDDNMEPKKRKLIPLDYDDDKSAGGDKKATAEEKRQKIKELIESIPTAKEELYAYTVDWDIVDQNLMDKRIKPWVNKKIIEYIGEEEPTLTEFICHKVVARSTPQSIQNDVAMILDEEAEVFVVKMWRLLVYETEAKKLGLVK
ncbi:RNA-binding protein 25-like [Physella acuta]|uniref:RNA-binding protein 25-like n=1 Tax=Physella acuta TaxID=109671 RepID=UPI0027DD6EE2|nr:RNA-binding protein 25-like [Physella acuta]